MRKCAALALLVVVLAIGAAGPAFAAVKDPFTPLVNPNAGASGSGTGGSTTDTGAPTGTGAGGKSGAGAKAGPGGTGPSSTEAGGGGNPNTGSDPVPWLVISYALIVTGSATIAIAYVMRRPHAPKPRR
jgi:hypothetical protein